jgi:pimeloyl-ACP methyl ester carboxylesterase
LAPRVRCAVVLHDEGGASTPESAPILLLHGLMGRGSTWRRCVPWLRRHGRVYTFDAAFHRGREPELAGAEADIRTERFVAEAAAAVNQIGAGPAVVIGHSMGGLHAWCLAAQHPELVRAIVVEDMAPDFKGNTTAPWDVWFDSWPEEFADAAAVRALFGEVAGKYFLESFDRTPTGWRLHGEMPVWQAIANHWGTRDYWAQWRAVQAPALLIEGERTITPPGQMAQMAAVERPAPTRYLKVAGAAHLIHDEAPEVYRGAVEAFLAEL